MGKSGTILYLHGFASSGASGTVDMLRKAFLGTGKENAVRVIAPDLPVEPAEALALIRATAEREKPNLIIGTSMGGMYAQQMRGYERICINPSFGMSKLYSLFHVGKYKWLNKRRDGALEFHVYKETIQHFQEMEAHQFEGIDEVDQLFCHGLFGDEDDVCGPGRAVFEQYYPGMSQLFHGGHRMNADAVKDVLIPFIHTLNVF